MGLRSCFRPSFGILANLCSSPSWFEPVKKPLKIFFLDMAHLCLITFISNGKLRIYELRNTIFNNVVFATSKGSEQPEHTRILIRAFAGRLNVKLLNEHHFEFLSLKGGCTGSSESIDVKMPCCWKPHVVAHFLY